LYGFSGPVSSQKTGLALAFSFYSSNRNPGKAFVGLSKKRFNCQCRARALCQAAEAEKLCVPKASSLGLVCLAIVSDGFISDDQK